MSVRPMKVRPGDRVRVTYESTTRAYGYDVDRLGDVLLGEFGGVNWFVNPDSPGRRVVNVEIVGKGEVVPVDVGVTVTSADGQTTHYPEGTSWGIDFNTTQVRDQAGTLLAEHLNGTVASVCVGDLDQP